MRLAFCNATRSWGGVKTWTIEFAAALAARGHEITLYGRPGAFIERAQSRSLAAVPVSFGMDFNPLAINLFLHEFRQRNIQAVLVNVGRDLRSAGVAARLMGLPLVQRIGLPGDMRNCLKVRLLHHLLRPHYLCPCCFIRDGMLATLPFIDERDTTVLLSAKTPAPQAPAHAGTPLRLVTTSQVNPNKGHEELLRVLAALRDAGHDFIWEVAGSGESESPLKALAHDLGLAERIIWHGFTQDVPAILARCDVFVLPSYIEGLPNTLLEAMAQGLVPVARNVGGTAEVWPQPLLSLLVPDGPRDGSGLRAALELVFQASRETLLSWKASAWEQCRAQFSLKRQAAALEQFFVDRIG